jgi:uncharacterized protein (TIGR03435 family)
MIQMMTEHSLFMLHLCRKLLLIAAACITFAAPCANGQATVESNGATSQVKDAPAQRLVFEVASIRPSDPLDSHQSMGMEAGGRFHATTFVETLIERSYGLRDFQILGGPKWLDSQKYDIEAKSDDVADQSRLTPQQNDALWERQKQRIQSLLADRFQMRSHFVKKELPVYALVVSKGGPKLQASKPGEAHQLYTQRPGQLACSNASMSEFTADLRDDGVSRIVIDKTGLAGNYDFSLRWTPDDAPQTDALGPDLFTALKEQLGLELQSQKAMVDVLVIDHIEPPSAN